MYEAGLPAATHTSRSSVLGDTKQISHCGPRALVPPPADFTSDVENPKTRVLEESSGRPRGTSLTHLP